MRGVLAGGALAVVVAADHGVLAGLAGPLRVVGVDLGEGESASLAMLLRNGSTAAPAGRISSVETLSPTLSAPGRPAGLGQRVELRQRCRCSGALTSSTLRAPARRQRRLEHRGVHRGRLRGSVQRAGRRCRAARRSRGSVITPVSAAAAAVSGEHSQTCRRPVPERPGKLRGKVRRLLRPDRRRLAHADAAHAAGLVDARPGLDQVAGRARLASGRRGSAARSG